MEKQWYRVLSPAVALALSVCLWQAAAAQSTLPCNTCHAEKHGLWLTGKHADTQQDVADELAEEWAGLPPDSVILGSEAENCVACHGPTAVAVGDGMTEVEVMAHFFTTTNGVYTDSTKAADEENWPHVFCTACHNVPQNHPTEAPVVGYFNSTSRSYEAVNRVSDLCGHCHGTVRFADTDHRRYDAWLMSKHGHGGQADVAEELAEEWAGSSPEDVVSGPEAENCVACHAPTAVQIGGGMSEADVLRHFFSTEADTFSESTEPVDTLAWPDVACNACHNPHKPDTLSFFNSSTGAYEIVSGPNEQCGQCHGNLRFPDTDHLSYNMEAGKGGVGVQDMVTMPGVKCVNCHMHQGEEEDTNAMMYGGHSWSVFIQEEDGTVTAACTSCHANMDADSAMAQVERWQNEFAALDSVAQQKVAAAEAYLEEHPDSLKQISLSEAQQNLFFAESDESGGFHNHKYAMALLNDAVEKASAVISAVEVAQGGVLPERFELSQNFPNPFNPSTEIKFAVPRSCDIVLVVYDVFGRRVKTLKQGHLAAGKYVVAWDGTDENGRQVAAGTYICQLRAGSFVGVRKMVLLR
ncbi:MAG: ammonia-forming cytochrome c nitrite reductase subunit c552 [Calditrichaeota bacterium]|nr:ammonia-forming cytochrome c nitrite reductase subunit c552 [Calditrichota bacterium]